MSFSTVTVLLTLRGDFIVGGDGRVSVQSDPNHANTAQPWSVTAARSSGHPIGTGFSLLSFTGPTWNGTAYQGRFAVASSQTQQSDFVAAIRANCRLGMTIASASGDPLMAQLTYTDQASMVVNSAASQILAWISLHPPPRLGTRS